MTYQEFIDEFKKGFIHAVLDELDLGNKYRSTVGHSSVAERMYIHFVSSGIDIETLYIARSSPPRSQVNPISRIRLDGTRVASCQIAGSTPVFCSPAWTKSTLAPFIFQDSDLANTESAKGIPLRNLRPGQWYRSLSSLLKPYVYVGPVFCRWVQLDTAEFLQLLS